MILWGHFLGLCIFKKACEAAAESSWFWVWVCHGPFYRRSHRVPRETRLMARAAIADGMAVGDGITVPVRPDESESLAAAIAHEVNNLLTPVVGLAELLEHTGADPAIRDQLIVQAVDRCQRAVAICEILLNLSKEVVPGERCGIAPCAQQAIEAVRSRAIEVGVQIQNSIDDPGTVAVPESVALHILINLLLNAVSASEPGGSVTLTAGYEPSNRWKSAFWRLSVIDRGRGLDQRQVSSINGMGMLKGSKGIGLAVTRTLCQRWGGSLSVESEQGSGSTFHVKLPAG